MASTRKPPQGSGPSSEDDENEGDEEEDDGEKIEDPPPDILAPKVMPSRSTRGQRITDMHQEGDDEFWSQALFQEEPDDLDYESETDEEDVPDADFFDPESESNDEEVDVEKEQRKKRSAYKDPAANKRTKLNPPKPEITKAPRALKRPKSPKQSVPSSIDSGMDSEPARKLRASTLTSTAERIRQEKLKELQPRKERVVKVYKILTQAERLREAQDTERINKESLKDLLRFEEDMRTIRAPKRAAADSRIITYSKGGHNSVTFTSQEAASAIFPSSPPQDPEILARRGAKCKITGLPAKYWDPKTQCGYATIEAFSQIRAQFNLEQRKTGKLPTAQRPSLKRPPSAPAVSPASSPRSPVVKNEPFSPRPTDGVDMNINNNNSQMQSLVPSSVIAGLINKLPLNSPQSSSIFAQQSGAWTNPVSVSGWSAAATNPTVLPVRSNTTAASWGQSTPNQLTSSSMVHATLASALGLHNPPGARHSGAIPLGYPGFVAPPPSPTLANPALLPNSLPNGPISTWMQQRLNAQSIQQLPSTIQSIPSIQPSGMQPSPYPGPISLQLQQAAAALSGSGSTAALNAATITGLSTSTTSLATTASGGGQSSPLTDSSSPSFPTESSPGKTYPYLNGGNGETSNNSNNKQAANVSVKKSNRNRIGKQKTR